MIKNDLCIYEAWDMQSPIFPERSRYYYLEPIGLFTAYTESLTSYLCRLAEAHCLNISTLMGKEMASIFPNGYIVKTGGEVVRDYYKRSNTINGISVNAEDFVRVLQVLTLREDLVYLTMLPWAEVLTWRGLLKNFRCWCPVCFDEWKKQGISVYEPLIWNLQAVSVCPKHEIPLQDICPECGRKMLVLEGRTRVGCCSKCDSWLGVYKNSKTSGEEKVQQRWISDNLGDLIAYGPKLGLFPDRDKLTESLLYCIKQVSAGNGAEFSRLVGVSKSTVSDWLGGKTIPSLQELLKICFICSVSLKDFLTEQDFSVCLSSKADYFTPKIQRKNNNLDYIEQELIKMADQKELEFLSLQEAARKLNVQVRTLSKRFPELAKIISTRYVTAQKEKAKQRIEKRCLEVRKVTIELYSLGVYPSRRKVEQILGGTIQEKKVQTAWKETLQELQILYL